MTQSTDAAVDCIVRLGEPQDTCEPKTLFLPMPPSAIVLAHLDLLTFNNHLPVLASQAHGQTASAFLASLAVPVPAASFLEDLGFPDTRVIDSAATDLFIRFLFAYRWEILKVCRARRRELFVRCVEFGIEEGMKVAVAGTCAASTVALSELLRSLFAADVITYPFT